MINQLWFAIFLVKTIETVYEPCADDTTGFCEHTCCHNKLKCDEVGGKPIYLGADSMIGIPQDNQGYHLYFSYRFLSNRFTKVSKYLKPTDYRYYGWNKRHSYKPIEQRNTDCFANANNTSPVRAIVHYEGKYIFVCNDKILVYTNYTFDKSPLFQGVERIIDRKSSECPDIYEPFCIRSEEDTLIEAVAVPGINGAEILVAYFGETEILDNYRYNREYEVRAYDDGQLVFRRKMVGQLSAIDIIATQDNKVRGLISKNDGMTCPFEYQIGHHNDYNFELLMDKTVCRSLQTFLACPQAWCADAFVDASFTVQDAIHKEMVYLLLFRDLWRFPAKERLPIDVPLVSERIILNLADNCTYAMPKNGQMVDPNVVPCCMMNSLAAFGMEVNNTEYVLGFKPKRGWRIVKNRTIERSHKFDTKLNVKGLLGDDSLYNATDLDAAWWDKKVQILYIFSGPNYFAFKISGRIHKKASWTLQKRGTLQEMGLIYDGQVEDGLDAVISMNGINYFFNQRFRYYEIPDGQTKFDGQPKLVQMHFFRLLSQCYYNDYEAYETLIRRLTGKLPRKKIYSRRQKSILMRKMKERSLIFSVRNLSIVIVLVGLLFTGTGLCWMHTHRKRREGKMRDKTSGHLRGHRHKTKGDKRGKDLTGKTEAKTVAETTPKGSKLDIAKQIELWRRKDDIQVFFKRPVSRL